MTALPTTHPLRRMFAGLTEHAFQSTLGVADPPLIDYLSELLSRFMHTDTIFRLRNRAGERLDHVGEMLTEAQSLPEGGRTQREVYRHIGDVALFWTGLFPDAVARSSGRGMRDQVLSYTESGKRCYLLASRFSHAECESESKLLFRLSSEFELCAFGLHQVRKEWEELATLMPANEPGRLICPDSNA